MSLLSNFQKEWVSVGNLESFKLLLLFVIACFLLVKWLSGPKLNLPPGPIGLPLLGYIPFLGKEPFKTFDLLKKKYGNVYSLYLGRTRVIILGEYTAVEEAFKNPATAYRPPGLFEFLPDGLGFLGANGQEWLEQRRFTMRTMKDIGLGRSPWINLVEDEVSDFVKILSRKNGHSVDIYEYLGTSVSNNIYSMVFGKRLPPGPELDALNKSADGVAAFFAQSAFFNFFPTLFNILVKLRIGNYYKSLEDLELYNNFIKKEIMHYRNTESGTKGTDFVAQYITAMQNHGSKEEGTYFTEKNLTGTAQVLFLGGTETVRTSLTWLFLAMASYPDVQQKVYNELHSTLKPEEGILWEDRIKIPYTYAATIEAQRWRTVGPINGQRIAVKNIKICGYDVPAGSVILGNNWGLHNDSRYWQQPEKFIPERFLRNGGRDVNLRAESYVPFSYGKRMCPGGNTAMTEIFLYFTAIMQRFEVRTPDGENPNLDGILGMTYQPVAQELCFVSRPTAVNVALKT